jgi:pyruvate dehydrogenase E2 component (dihydrolipoamide acetyltransferase)
MPIKVLMPALSPTMTEGNLAKWHKSEGDAVESGDVIAEIETDKATMEVEAVDDGIIGKIIIPEGTQGVAVNAMIAILLEDGENDNDMAAMLEGDAPASKPAPKVETPQAEVKPMQAQTQSAPQAPTSTGSRIYASPLARRIANDKGLDLANIKGSGPKGRIVKSDVENAQGGSSASSAPSQVTSSMAVTQPTGDQQVNEFGMVYTAIPNNNIKKIVASRLQESKQTVPHFYLTIECKIDELLKTRKVMNDQSNGEYKLSVNDFIVKAAAMALKAYPPANVSWSDDAVRQYVHADISVAVSTPNGLMTPIVKQAEFKGLKDISTYVKMLAGKARDGKLQPEEFQGGSFTVSNLGMFGIKEFGAIINPPQACILAVGAGEQKPCVIDSEIKIATIMSCTLSVDHRAVDGAVGAEYLQILKKFIENPATMLL